MGKSDPDNENRHLTKPNFGSKNTGRENYKSLDYSWMRRCSHDHAEVHFEDVRVPVE